MYQESWLDFVRLNGKCPTSVKIMNAICTVDGDDDDVEEEKMLFVSLKSVVETLIVEIILCIHYYGQ